MGFLVDEKAPVVWRGLMIIKALHQLTREVDWSGTDILVIDMPPGTGDTQISIAQSLPISGSVIVTTPQDVALADAIKGVEMFSKFDIPIIGLVQNMSVFKCPCCGNESHIFGNNGAEKVALDLKTKLLCNVPINSEVCRTSDAGMPIVIQDPQSVHSLIYMDLAKQVNAFLKL